jgi:hypothetical protein
MSSSNQLFQLIQSMSKSEKRYFKLFAGRHTIGEKNYYLELFDAVDKQSGEYDEAAILKRFEGSKMAKNLSSVKVQLTNLILRSLRQYKGSKKKKYDVRSYLDYADILFEKGLYGHGQKVLQKAKKIAIDYDLLVALDEISIMEHKIAVKTFDLEELQRCIKEDHPESRKVRELNNMMAEFESLAARLRVVSIESKYYPNLKTVELRNIMQHPLLQIQVANLPYLGQIEWYDIWSLYHVIRGDFEKAYDLRSHALALLEQKQNKIHDSPQTWIHHARRMLILLGTFHRYKEFDAEMVRVRNFIKEIPEDKKTTNLKTEIYTTIYIAALDIDIDRGLFERGAEFAKEVETGFKDLVYQISTDGQIVLYYNLFYVYFGNREYSKALRWLNQILNNNYGNIRLDIQCYARIVNIILHYELGNHELIAGLVRSSDRFISKHDLKKDFESAFLRNAVKYLQEPFNKNMREPFQKHITILEEITSDPSRTRALEFFDVICWLRSRVEGRTFAELMREKAGE